MEQKCEEPHNVRNFTFEKSTLEMTNQGVPEVNLDRNRGISTVLAKGVSGVSNLRHTLFTYGE